MKEAVKEVSSQKMTSSKLGVTEQDVNQLYPISLSLLWMMTSLSLTSLRVKTDLMSLTQHWFFYFKRRFDCFTEIVITCLFFSVILGYRCRNWDQEETREEGKEAQEAWKEVARTWRKRWCQRWSWGMFDFIILPCMFWFEIWPTRGPVSVYDMLYQPDSEPLAGPKQWTWSLKWVRHHNHRQDIIRLRLAWSTQIYIVY